MILVCNALMNDLNHPNEYVRWSMFQFLCKEKDLSPPVSSVKAFVKHRHSYVLKFDAITIFHAHKCFGVYLIPDAPQLMQSFVLVQTDFGAHRNALSLQP